jgi:predicted RNA-binding protein
MGTSGDNDSSDHDSGVPEAVRRCYARSIIDMVDADSPERNYWIIVSSLENWHATVEHDFTVQGIKSRRRKSTESMHPGDKFIYYCTGVKSFAGITTVTSDVFEDHTPIWKSGNKKKAEEDYPYRFEIEKDLALTDDQLVPAEPIARQMIYAQKWPAEHWTLAFQGNVHNIPEEDYELIRGEIEKAAKE